MIRNAYNDAALRLTRSQPLLEILLNLEQQSPFVEGETSEIFFFFFNQFSAALRFLMRFHAQRTIAEKTEFTLEDRKCFCS